MMRGLQFSCAVFVAFLFVLSTSALRAAEAPPAAEDPQLEARVQHVTEQLRCLVCQNQTIADSNADLARDLRREVRQMLVQGKSEAEIREFMVARYGDFVLYRPPLKSITVLLWFGPFALLLVAVWAYRRLVTNRSPKPEAPELSSEDRQRLQSLIGAEPKPGRR
jgi:cytochrome c-type biogenesis protein CcmH